MQRTFAVDPTVVTSEHAPGERLMLLAIIERALWDYRDLAASKRVDKVSGEGVRKKQMNDIREWFYSDDETELSLRWIANLVSSDPDGLVCCARRALEDTGCTRRRTRR